ncbi:MAG TPA: AraC family transcriptional regulator [Usitatibacter sp.]|nr:AraC family transcriptional regulator [Usitatibacter sp.]
MDALSDVLKSVRLEGAVYLEAEFTAPWCIQANAGLESVARRLAGAEHVVFFHYVAEGGFQVHQGDGLPPLPAREGDLIVFPQDVRQLMGSDLRLAPVEANRLPYENPDDPVVRLSYGGGGSASRMVCGYIACSRSVCRPLLDALPPVLVIHVGDDAGSGMTRELLRVAVRESWAQRPGAESLLTKVAELMFVEALRRYAASLPPGGTGWLAGVRDAHVGRALAALHGDPARPWTVEELAAEAALSRSALAEKFAALVGEPPMQYLSRWRLALAAQALRTGTEPISRIAERSGYDSEAAFGRAFKREFGKPPAAWRRASKKPA